jgi:hypothetical protein
MPKCVCYIHVGPHKTGTSSIQWFLKENRAELLKYGYFVPESGTMHGGHHPLARKLCGRELPNHQQSVDARFAQMIAATPCEAVVISSEALDGLLKNADSASAFFNRIRELNLEPKLVVFARNQSQSINSRYAQVVRGFRRSEPFETFFRTEIHHPSFKYAFLLRVAEAFDAELIARPFTSETIAHGVVHEFLRAIGLEQSGFPNTEVRRNPVAGPFTISVARGVMRSIGSLGRQLKWRQAERCKRRLSAYLEENGLADTGYCGLTTTLARQIERELRSDNDAFAQSVWGRSWGEIFAADMTEEFTPNDFEMRPPDWSTAGRLRRAIRRMNALVHEILSDPELAVEAPWNDVARRSG